MIIIIQSVCLALFMDHREQTCKVVVVENHVTHRLSSSFHSTLTKRPSSPIAPAEKNVWRRHCSHTHTHPPPHTHRHTDTHTPTHTPCQAVMGRGYRVRESEWCDKALLHPSQNPTCVCVCVCVCVLWL